MDFFIDDFEEIDSVLALYTTDGEVEVRFQYVGDSEQHIVYLDEYFEGTRLTRRKLIEALEDHLGCPVLQGATISIEWVEVDCD